MKKTNIILMALALICCQAMVTRGQQVIVTDDPVYTSGEASAVLDIKSDSKGLIIPRLTQSARDIITSPATGLIIFQTDGTPGFYYNAGTSSSPSWQLLGGESFSLPYAGSTSVDDFAFSVTNSQTHAIAGIATAASGTNFGVQGEAASPDGAGLFGYGSSTSGNAYGIIGQSASATGTGVLGIAIETTGANYGIKGQTFSSSGIGILGQAMAGNGTTYGVYGSVNSSSGYAGYFTGGRVFIQGNLGVGGTATPAKLSVVGIANNPSLPGTSSSGVIRIGVNSNEGIDIGKMSGIPFTGWIQSGWNQIMADPLALQPLGGNVGIGTTDPGYELDVNGDVNVSGNFRVNGDAVARTYQVGDFAHGGIVFWIDESGQHGIVCAKTNWYLNLRWYAGSNTYTMALGDGPLAGKMNTAIIIANQGRGDGDIYAARLCNELIVTEGGVTYGDWYLPSISELYLMCLNKSIIDSTAVANGGGIFVSGYYHWSSREVSDSNAEVIDFYNCLTTVISKFYENTIRPVRAF